VKKSTRRKERREAAATEQELRDKIQRMRATAEVSCEKMSHLWRLLVREAPDELFEKAQCIMNGEQPLPVDGDPREQWISAQVEIFLLRLQLAIAKEGCDSSTRAA
jgi:hypothetical protein